MRSSGRGKKCDDDESVRIECVDDDNDDDDDDDDDANDNDDNDGGISDEPNGIKDEFCSS